MVYSEGTMFNAKVAFRPPAVLKDVVFYQISPSGRLDATITADRATASPTGSEWEFQNGKPWSLSWTEDALGWLSPADETFFALTEVSVPL